MQDKNDALAHNWARPTVFGSCTGITNECHISNEIAAFSNAKIHLYCKIYIMMV